MNNKINIHFLGDAVTGSKYLLEALDNIIMIDCGQFREPEDWAELNLLQPAVEITDIDLAVFPCVHSPQPDILPKLIKLGFTGRIISPASTTSKQEELAKRREETDFWPDSRWSFNDTPSETLPNLQGIEKSLTHFRETPEGIWITVDNHIRIRFQYSEAFQEYVFIELDVSGERLFLTGEIGQRAENTTEAQETAAWYSGRYTSSSAHSADSHRSTPESSFWLG